MEEVNSGKPKVFTPHAEQIEKLDVIATCAENKAFLNQELDLLIVDFDFIGVYSNPWNIEKGEAQIVHEIFEQEQDELVLTGLITMLPPSKNIARDSYQNNKARIKEKIANLISQGEKCVVLHVFDVDNNKLVLGCSPFKEVELLTLIKGRVSIMNCVIAVLMNKIFHLHDFSQSVLIFSSIKKDDSTWHCIHIANAN